MRIPHAARTLTTQVREGLNRKPDSKAGLETSRRVGEPDGLGVYRSIEFDPVASAYLKRVGEVLITDPRIEDLDSKGEGKAETLTVTFSARTIADDRTPFDLISESDEAATD